MQTVDGKRRVELNGSSKRRDLKNDDLGWKEEIIQQLGNLETPKQEAEQLMESVTFEVIGGHPKPHIWNQRPQFAYSLYNFYGATTTIKGSLHESTPIVKRFSVENFLSPVKIGPKNVGFSGITGCKC